jgi:hypothetical protein
MIVLMLTTTMTTMMMTTTMTIWIVICHRSLPIVAMTNTNRAMRRSTCALCTCNRCKATNSTHPNPIRAWSADAPLHRSATLHVQHRPLQGHCSQVWSVVQCQVLAYANSSRRSRWQQRQDLHQPQACQVLQALYHQHGHGRNRQCVYNLRPHQQQHRHTLNRGRHKHHNHSLHKHHSHSLHKHHNHSLHKHDQRHRHNHNHQLKTLSCQTNPLHPSVVCLHLPSANVVGVVYFFRATTERLVGWLVGWLFLPNQRLVAQFTNKDPEVRFASCDTRPSPLPCGNPRE